MLTASNIPRGHCVICLYGFQEEDSLTKTSCFHHFHSHCLGRYAKHCLEQKPEEDVLCPVCREHLTCDFRKLQEALPPQQSEELYVPDTCALQREKDLRQIYERQLANGGIIDIEAEKNRFFISIQENPAVSVPNEESTQQAGITSREEHSHAPVTSKQQIVASAHTGLLRAKAQPVQREHRETQHWRGSRGWTGRPRMDTRRVWRDEVGHRDFQPQTRGRGKPRGFHPNGTMRTPLRGSNDSVLEEKHAL
ncbi:E3 ubiquitin-protein ligase RNF25 [Pyxicephalus adspersus]